MLAAVACERSCICEVPNRTNVAERITLSRLKSETRSFAAFGPLAASDMSKNAYREGGTRGGAGSFKWEDVKTEKYRECYLGHSLMAPIGRWQKGKDLTWYNKASKQEQKLARDEEIARIKAEEEQMMLEALGIKQPERRTSSNLDSTDKEKLFGKNTFDHEGVYAERIEGLGAAPYVFL